MNFGSKNQITKSIDKESLDLVSCLDPFIVLNDFL